MRCPRCNVAIPNGSEVCPECGCHVCAEKSPAAQKPKKSWLQRLISVLVVIAIVSAARYVGEMAGEKAARSMQEPDSSPQTAVQETVNPAFEAYLSQRGAVYESRLADSECVILELDGGFFEVLEYGHIGDRLTEFYETIYLSMAGYSAEEVELVKSNAREVFGSALNPSYTSMDEDVQGEYLLLQIHWKNLADPEVVQELTQDGLTTSEEQGDEIDFLSLKITLEDVLAKGGIQR